MAFEAFKPKETSQQSEDVESQGDWFTQRRLPDDVTLKFDDGKELFASRGLLMCASLVFEAMFTHDIKEKETNVVEMPGRNYDHFLELLKCLHPDIAKPVTHENVFYLAVLAHEYDMKGLLKRCHDVFTIIMLHKGTLSEKDFQLKTSCRSETEAWLEENNKRTSWYSNTNIKPANTILKVLSSAAKFQDELLITEAINMLSYIPVIDYDNIQQCLYNCIDQNIIKQNKAMFDQLDAVIRERISRARLYRIDISK